MRVQALMDAETGRIQEKWPGEPVYPNYLPNDFKSPSFTLELQRDEWKDGNIILVQRAVTLLLTGYVEPDPYGDSAREALNQRMETACGLFAQGFLPVGDRAVPVRTVRGNGAPGFFEVTLIFSWMDERPSVSGSDDPSGKTPMMERYKLNILTKE